MFVMASYNERSGSNLSLEDFCIGNNDVEYEKAFEMYNAASDNEKLSVDGFELVLDEVEASDIEPEIYEEQFEYIQVLAEEKGCFTGNDLKIDRFMEVMLGASGISPEDMDKLNGLDFTTYFNKMYFTVLGLLPIFVFVIIAANSLIAAQVDKGSMAYILSTPVKRSSVAATQAVYLIAAPLVLMAVTCGIKMATPVLIFGEVNIERTLLLYLGLYLVTEAAAGFCYLCSYIFNQSQKALAVGVGVTLWFFLAALLGMFGSEDMVSMGVGTDALGMFNKLTIVSLFDVDAVQSIGTDCVDTGFIPGMIILAVLSAVCYLARGVKFCKKDLPL